jgi:thiamine pyrophosphate-dependent acetolactate synthase large subunit-like protein
MPLTSFGPSPRYADMAEAAGAWGRRIEAPDDVEAGLREAFERAADGQAAVVEVITAPGTR